MPPHAGFIVAAYLVTGLVLAGAVLAVVLDHRAQRRALARLQSAAADRPQRSGDGRKTS